VAVGRGLTTINRLPAPWPRPGSIVGACRTMSDEWGLPCDERAAARDNGVPLSSIIACSEVDNSLPPTADVEDLFDVEDYLRLYNLAFNTGLSTGDLAQTTEPILRRI
jgi:hypothetical protein